MGPHDTARPFAVAALALVGAVAFAATLALTAAGVSDLRKEPKKPPRLGIPAGERPANVSTNPTK